MGIVRMGPPTEIIHKLREIYGITKFIETGTFLGDTAYWASALFEYVSTIEGGKDIYKQVTEKYGHVRNIEFMYGNSTERLSEIVSKLDTSSIFWLDAHWMGEGTYGENKECPIIEEIEIINRSEYEQFIFLDDARLFLSPPPPPHEIEQWPDINLVLSTLSSAKTHRYIVIIEDVIIAVPVFAKSILAQTCQEINKRIWKEYLRQQQMPTKIEKGIDLIAQDFTKIIQSPQKIINHILRILK